MGISPSQKNELIWITIFVICVLLVFGITFFIDNYLNHRMNEVCHNLSMEYFYKDSGSFYCISPELPIRIKEIRYT